MSDIYTVIVDHDGEQYVATARNEAGTTSNARDDTAWQAASDALAAVMPDPAHDDFDARIERTEWTREIAGTTSHGGSAHLDAERGL